MAFDLSTQKRKKKMVLKSGREVCVISLFINQNIICSKAILSISTKYYKGIKCKYRIRKF